MDVGAWLRDLGLGQCEAAFRDNQTLQKAKELCRDDEKLWSGDDFRNSLAVQTELARETASRASVAS
jgi:hypothetical protein